MARYTSIILLPVYTKTFSSSTVDYGVLQSVTNLGALLLAFTALGLDGAAALLYFETDDPQQRRSICALWVWISIAASVPVTLLLIASADWVSLAAVRTTQYAYLFRLGIAVLPFSLLQVVFSQILRLTFRPRLYALLNFSLATLTALISIYLVVVAHMGPAGALWGTLIGTAIVIVVSAWVLRDTLLLADIGPNAWLLARRMLKLGRPLVPAGIALWVISFSNTYFLNRLVGTSEAGIFRAGAQLAALLGIGIWAFQLAWGPMSLSIAREPDAARTYSRVATLYSAGAVGASVLLAGFAPLLVRVLTSADYASASSVIGLLALAAAALGAYYVVAIGVNLAQRTGQIAWTTIVAAITSLMLNALLIPIWGIVGAGLASLAANLTSTTLVYLMSQRYHPLPYQPFKLLAIWLSGSLCVALAGVFNVAAQPSLWASSALALVLFAGYTLALFVIGAIRVSEIRVAWKALVGNRVRGGPVGAHGRAPLPTPSPYSLTLFPNPLWPLIILTIVAFVLRVGFMVVTHTLNAPPVEDALDYHNLAVNMLAGHGYSLAGAQIVNRAPAYPVMLALIYAVFGQQPAAVRLVQALLISALAPVIYYIGSKVREYSVGAHGRVPLRNIPSPYSLTLGLLASALFAVYPFSIFWGQYMITENLLVVLFVALAALLVRPNEAGPLRLLGAGAVMGLSLLTRPTALPVVVGLFVWLLFALKRRWTIDDGRWTKSALAYRPSSIVHRLFLVLRPFALLLTGLALALSPWVVRNYVQYGQFIPFTSGYGSSAGGYVFWISNNALTARPGDSWGRYVDPALLPDYREYNAPPNDPASMDRKGYQFGLRYLTSHPGDMPILLLGKFLRFWNVFPGLALYTRAIGALALLLLPFFLLGLREIWRKPQAGGGMLLAFIVGTMLVGLIFWADTRTRAPTEPFILLTSAVGAVSLLRNRKDAKTQRFHK